MMTDSQEPEAGNSDNYGSTQIDEAGWNSSKSSTLSAPALQSDEKCKLKPRTIYD